MWKLYFPIVFWFFSITKNEKSPWLCSQGSQVLQDVWFDVLRVVHQAVAKDAQQQVVHENQ
jgi:hypothetical protein